jgi:hypothetical protein
MHAVNRDAVTGERALFKGRAMCPAFFLTLNDRRAFCLHDISGPSRNIGPAGFLLAKDPKPHFSLNCF